MFNISFNGREIEYEKNINIVNCDTVASQILVTSKNKDHKFVVTEILVIYLCLCVITEREEAIKPSICLARKLALICRVGPGVLLLSSPESGLVINTVKGVLINLATLTIIFTRWGSRMLSVY